MCTLSTCSPQYCKLIDSNWYRQRMLSQVYLRAKEFQNLHREFRTSEDPRASKNYRRVRGWAWVSGPNSHPRGSWVWGKWQWELPKLGLPVQPQISGKLSSQAAWWLRLTRGFKLWRRKLLKLNSPAEISIECISAPFLLCREVDSFWQQYCYFVKSIFSIASHTFGQCMKSH